MRNNPTTHLCVDDALFCTIHTQVVMPKNAKQGQSVKKTTVPKPKILLAEAESRVVGAPAAAQPVPVHHNLTAAPAEIRDTQVAVADLHDRSPQEDCLAGKQLAEHGDTLLLNGEPILQVEARREDVVVLEVLVDGVAHHGTTILVVVEPLLNSRLQIVFSGTRALQLGMLQLLEPVGVGRLHRPVHADGEVQWWFGDRLGPRCLNQQEFICEEPLGSADTSEFVEHSFYTDIFQIQVVFHNILLRLLVGILSPPVKQRAAWLRQPITDARGQPQW